MAYFKQEYIFLVVFLCILGIGITVADELDTICQLKSTIDNAISCYERFESHNSNWRICTSSSSENKCFPLQKYIEFLEKYKNDPDYVHYGDYVYYNYDDYPDNEPTKMTNNSETNVTGMGNSTARFIVNDDFNATLDLEHAGNIVEQDDGYTKKTLVLTGVLSVIMGFIIGCILTFIYLKVWRKSNRSFLCLNFDKHDVEHINSVSGDRTQPREDERYGRYEALRPIHLGNPDDKIPANRASMHHYLGINHGDNDIYENVKYLENNLQTPIINDVDTSNDYDGYTGNKDGTVEAPKAHTGTVDTINDSDGYIDCSGTAVVDDYIVCSRDNIPESGSEPENEQSNNNILAPMVNELKETVKRFKEVDDDADDSEYVEPSKDDMYINSSEYVQDFPNGEQELYQNT